MLLMFFYTEKQQKKDGSTSPSRISSPYAMCYDPSLVPLHSESEEAIEAVMEEVESSFKNKVMA